MDKVEQIADIVLFVMTLAGFLYGIRHILSRQKGAFYRRMIALGVGCAMLGRLHNIVDYAVRPGRCASLGLGALGVVGCFLFFFTANYGTVDGLVDDKTKAMRPYRLTAFAAPVVLLGLYVPVLFLSGHVAQKVLGFIFTLILMLTSYYHMKHLIIPDVDFGIVKSVRGYNLVALLLSVFSMVEMVSGIYGSLLFRLLAQLGVAVCMVLVLPVLNKGVTKWTI